MGHWSEHASADCCLGTPIYTTQKKKSNEYFFLTEALSQYELKEVQSDLISCEAARLTARMATAHNQSLSEHHVSSLSQTS